MKIVVLFIGSKFPTFNPFVSHHTFFFTTRKFKLPKEQTVSVPHCERCLRMAMYMAIQATSTARPAISSLLQPSTPRASWKPQLRPTSVALPASTTISLLALFTSTQEAKALSLAKDQIVSSLTEVEKTIDQVQEVGSSFFDNTQRILEVVGNALKPAVDSALPIASKAGEQALKIASPALSEASKKAQEAIQSTGLDTEPVVSAAKTVADAAQKTTQVIEESKPIASSAVETISTADPIVIVGTAGVLFLTYLVLPPIWSAITFNLRGYKGELSPAQTLDLLSTNNHFMVDIRPEKDKGKAGVPRLPSNVKNKMIAIPLEELPSKLRRLVRNVKKVEAEITAIKISYLKRVNKSSNIVIMDSYSDSAKLVARALSSLGFKNCWIVADGFSGNRGWMQSRLGTESYNFSVAEVISPSRIIPAATRRFGTTTGTKFLPGAE